MGARGVWANVGRGGPWAQLTHRLMFDAGSWATLVWDVGGPSCPPLIQPLLLPSLLALSFIRLAITDAADLEVGSSEDTQGGRSAPPSPH